MNIIFIGDYLDSYERKVIEQLRTLDLVLDAVRSSNGRVRALKGNHEMAYLNRTMSCSGNTIGVMAGLLDRDLSPLLTHIWVKDDILVSHAGVSQRLLSALDYTSVYKYLDAGHFNQIGRARGGRDAIGGLYWCDWWREFEPVNSIRQIVGHTSYRPEGTDPGIVTNGNDYNIECLDRVPQVLIVDDEGEISYDMFEVPGGLY